MYDVIMKTFMFAGALSLTVLIGIVLVGTAISAFEFHPIVGLIYLGFMLGLIGAFMALYRDIPEIL